MDFKALTRDPAKVHAFLKELEDGSVITTKGCKIYSPARYRDKELAQFGNETYIVAIFAMTVEDKYYAVSLVNAMIRIEPSTVNIVQIDQTEYLEFVFEAGDVVFAGTDLVKDDKLPYFIFDEIIAKGNVPVYLGVDDVVRLFDTAKSHANIALYSTPTVMHMVIAMTMRYAKDLSKYYRQLTNGNDPDMVVWMPLRSATHGATNTTARLLRAHFADNLTSALVTPSDREENIERILRM